MEAIYRNGNTITVDYTPSAAVSAGDIVIQGTLVGVAARDIAAGALGSLQVNGIFSIAKNAGQMFTAGSDVYLDLVDRKVDSLPGVYLGKCVKAGASADTTLDVLLCQQEAAMTSLTTTSGS